MIYKAMILGALTAIIIIFGLLIASSFIINNEKEVYHTTNITVSGKICNDNVFGSVVSKIQGDDGILYFIPNSDCDLYPIGRSGMIFYNHVCQGAMPETFCFNKTVGDYT
jgi:hypothetical protein